MHSNVVTFPGRSKPKGSDQTKRFKLSAVDKIDVCRWEAEGGSPAISRVAIYEGEGDREADADVILLYTPSAPWARWGIARRGGEVLLWQCAGGCDLGVFRSVRDALNEVSMQTPHANAGLPPLRVVLG